MVAPGMEVFILFPAMPMPMTRRPATRLLVLALALAAAPAFAQKSRTFSETVFFGDSLTDGGSSARCCRPPRRR